MASTQHTFGVPSMNRRKGRVPRVRAPADEHAQHVRVAKAAMLSLQARLDRLNASDGKGDDDMMGGRGHGGAEAIKAARSEVHPGLAAVHKPEARRQVGAVLAPIVVKRRRPFSAGHALNRGGAGSSKPSILKRKAKTANPAYAPTKEALSRDMAELSREYAAAGVDVDVDEDILAALLESEQEPRAALAAAAKAAGLGKGKGKGKGSRGSLGRHAKNVSSVSDSVMATDSKHADAAAAAAGSVLLPPISFTAMRAAGHAPRASGASSDAGAGAVAADSSDEESEVEEGADDASTDYDSDGMDLIRRASWMFNAEDLAATAEVEAAARKGVSSADATPKPLLDLSSSCIGDLLAESLDASLSLDSPRNRGKRHAHRATPSRGGSVPRHARASSALSVAGPAPAPALASPPRAAGGAGSSSASSVDLSPGVSPLNDSPTLFGEAMGFGSPSNLMAPPRAASRGTSRRSSGASVNTVNSLPHIASAAPGPLNLQLAASSFGIKA